VKIASAARSLAESLLARELPRRWAHVRAVVDKAGWVSTILNDGERELLVAAAWLHDIGYASSIVVTGFHPLDGARWLRGQGFDERLTALVAHHSCALLEADERGLAVELTREFEREESVVADALWFCDLTTGPNGQDFGVAERLDEIRLRYGPNHLVTRFVDRAQGQLLAAAGRTADRLMAAEIVQPM
jgi:HD domain